MRWRRIRSRSNRVRKERNPSMLLDISTSIYVGVDALSDVSEVPVAEVNKEPVHQSAIAILLRRSSERSSNVLPQHPAHSDS